MTGSLILPLKQFLMNVAEPVTVEGQPSPYDGPLGVHSYAAAYAQSLTVLEQIVATLAAPSGGG
jgi:hypothetical protein